MISLRLAAVLVASLLAVTWFTACGGDDDDGGATSPAETNGASPSSTRDSDSSDRTSRPSGAPEVRLKLIAEELRFDLDELSIPRNSLVTLDLTNRDDVPHNFAAYRTEASTEPIFVGETFSGPGVATVYQFDGPADAGTYFFRCDIHPADMTAIWSLSSPAGAASSSSRGRVYRQVQAGARYGCAALCARCTGGISSSPLQSPSERQGHRGIEGKFSTAKRGLKSCGPAAANTARQVLLQGCARVLELRLQGGSGVVADAIEPPNRKFVNRIEVTES